MGVFVCVLLSGLHGTMDRSVIVSFLGNTHLFYQLPLILIALLHVKRCLSQGMYLYKVIMTLHFLNNVDPTRKSKSLV